MGYALVVLAALVVSGCAGRAGSAEAPATAGAGGVEVSAALDAWQAWPPELGRVVTAVRVSVVNRGERPVRVDVTRFALALGDGRRLAAMLPTDVRTPVAVPAPSALPQAGLALGPTRENSGAGWTLNDPGHDPRPDPTQATERARELPSADMLALALPEGVLAPGRAAAGFIYFERPPRGVRDVTLTWPVVDDNGEPLGEVRIALTVR